MTILITGGAGYIGSHIAVELLSSGYDVVVLDNFSNSKPEAVKRIREITSKNFIFHEADLLDMAALRKIFSADEIDAVIHCAGFKSVGESVKEPLKYYQNNLAGLVSLLLIMREYNLKKLVFSSSATVYGAGNLPPFTEDMPKSAVNPYGWTKYMIEQILKDVYYSDNGWSIAILRYFNPVGAHESGLIGEDPNGIPNNFMPYMTQVAAGKLDKLYVFGDDYDTHDGTGVRDYIHVVDLAKGHLKAVEKITDSTGLCEYNLGTGVGYSVLDMVSGFEKATGIAIPYEISGRRPGDIGMCCADPSKALKELGWKAGKSLADMCRDSWRWQRANPDGYA